MKLLLIGSGAREHAIARAISGSPQKPELLCFGSALNPGIQALTSLYVKGKMAAVDQMAQFARQQSVDLVIVGPEAPLGAGVADRLGAEEIPCVGPEQVTARLETSKGFTRHLMETYRINAYPRFQSFDSLSGVEEFLRELGDAFVVKYDGLMGGKGVKVAGEHLHSHEEALDYARQLIAGGGRFVIEEKLEGEEFSLMSFCDGKTLRHTVPVQDHKRAFDGDQGPNTGGMGSYSGAGGRLPFLQEEDVRRAEAINEAVAEAVVRKTGVPYRGILYGGFMATADGVKVIEYNVRFGDPEAMNVLALLETDFMAICEAIVRQELDRISLRFRPAASVCKYAVPEGYPDHPVKGRPVDVSGVQNQDGLYLAAVDLEGDQLVETGSRTAAVVAVADTLEAAEQRAEADIARIRGPLYHRKDIGTGDLIRKRIAHMQALRNR